MNNNIMSFITNVGKLWLKYSENTIQKQRLENLFQNITKINQKNKKWLNKRSIEVPSMLVINITTKCNLKCKGCYFEEERDKNELSYNEINKVILQAKEIGIFLFIIIGGEPFLRTDVLINLMRNHKDVLFLIFTNGTKIDKKTANHIAILGNVSVLFSIEGFKEYTDKRRGSSVYDTVTNTMKLFKKKKLFFGFSVTVTKKNLNIVTKSEFVEEMIRYGCKIGWYTNFVPASFNSYSKYSISGIERKLLEKRIVRLKNNKKITLIHFGDEKENCSAGKKFLYLNYDGSITPCPFVSWSSGNIKEKSIKEILCQNIDFDKIIQTHCH